MQSCEQNHRAACQLAQLPDLLSSVNHLQRKLYLARGAGGLADDAKAAAPQNVGWQPEIHQVEHVEKLGAKFQGAELCISAAAEGRVLDQRDVEILEARSAEGVAPQGAKAAVVRAGASGQVDRNGK